MPAKPLCPSPLRIDATSASGNIRHVADELQAQELIALLEGSNIAAIAVDSEFYHASTEFELRSGRSWTDIRSVRPVCVSLAALVVGSSPDEPEAIFRAVLDVRRPGVVTCLDRILRLRVPFVFHYAKSELFTFWALGLDPGFPSLYDTNIAAAALRPGHGHKRPASAVEEDDPEQIQDEEERQEARAHELSLVGQCVQYGLAYPYAGAKDDLRRSFAHLGADQSLATSQLAYAAADAEYTLRLYLAQQRDLILAGLHAQLCQVEFPFTIANARMEWRGVHISRDGMERVLTAAHRAEEYYARKLVEHGIDPPGSRDKFLGLMRREGLIQHFRRADKLSTRKELLESLELLHPTIREYRLHKRYQHLAGEEWLRGALVGADGRTHPAHHQLGAATGRNTCTSPNIVGIGRVLRPIVTAPPDRALIELDYGQIEVGVAAAEFQDPDLIAAYNSGDVYSAIAQRVYAEDLTECERALASSDFKKARRALRERMKIFVLAVMYGMRAPAIARLLGVFESAAEEERLRFLATYPVLDAGIKSAVAAGVSRGYATTVGGLRRHVEPGRPVDSWTRNFLRNTPIQGSAAMVFKTAVVRLDQAFRGSDTWLVLPIHDAILIECATSAVEDVAAGAKAIMQDALRAYYPELIPKVEVNLMHSACWNKDGHADSLDRFLEDPEFRIDAPPKAAPVPTPSPISVERDETDLHGDLVAEMQRVLGWSSVGGSADQPELLLDDWIERFEERAAIIEYDGGRPRPVAEAMARAHVLRDLHDCLVVAANANAVLPLVAAGMDQ